MTAPSLTLSAWLAGGGGWRELRVGLDHRVSADGCPSRLYVAEACECRPGVEALVAFRGEGLAYDEAIQSLICAMGAAGAIASGRQR